MMQLNGCVTNDDDDDSSLDDDERRHWRLIEEEEVVSTRRGRRHKQHHRRRHNKNNSQSMTSSSMIRQPRRGRSRRRVRSKSISLSSLSPDREYKVRFSSLGNNQSRKIDDGTEDDSSYDQVLMLPK